MTQTNSGSPILSIDVQKNDGTHTTLAEHKGKVLLIVNVASKCGLTPQYAALEKAHEQFKGKGLEILGFPANDFMGQEPGSDAEIKDFCETKFNVQFPIYKKISVVGEAQHPLYKELTHAKLPEATGGDMEEKLAGYGHKKVNHEDVLWNFEKFLVGRDGQVVARFLPDVTPDDPRLVKAIEGELAKS